MVEEHSKYCTLSQVLRRTVQIAEYLFDGGHQALHDIVLCGVKLRQCAMRHGTGAFLQSWCLFLHHCLFDVSSRITDVLKWSK